MVVMMTTANGMQPTFCVGHPTFSDHFLSRSLPTSHGVCWRPIEGLSRQLTSLLPTKSVVAMETFWIGMRRRVTLTRVQYVYTWQIIAVHVLSSLKNASEMYWNRPLGRPLLQSINSS